MTNLPLITENKGTINTAEDNWGKTRAMINNMAPLPITNDLYIPENTNHHVAVNETEMPLPNCSLYRKTVDGRSPPGSLYGTWSPTIDRTEYELVFPLSAPIDPKAYN